MCGKVLTEDTYLGLLSFAFNPPVWPESFEKHTENIADIKFVLWKKRIQYDVSHD